MKYIALLAFAIVFFTVVMSLGIMRTLRKHCPTAPAACSLKQLGKHPITNVFQHEGQPEYPLFVSFYTGDNGYGIHAESLIESLNKWNLSYYIVEINSLGDKWETICQIKPHLILQALDMTKKSVVWVDADATIEDTPDEFLKIDASDKSVGVHYWKERKLGSGTIYFKNDPTSRKIIQDWIRENIRHPSAWDQITLQTVLNNYKKSEYILPVAYLAIFDDARADNSNVKDHYQRPVIVHWQASRILRAVSDSKQTAVSLRSEVIRFHEENVDVAVPSEQKEIFKLRTNTERLFRRIISSMIAENVIDPSKNIIDLGCWIGDNAVPWSLMIQGVVYAIDPSDENVKLVQKLVDLNGIQNIHVMKRAISSAEEDLYYKGSLKHVTFKRDKGSYTSHLKSTTLDILENSGEVSNIGFVHLDVEGLEYDVLRGGIKLIEKYRPIITTESHRGDKDVSEILKPLRYSATEIPEICGANKTCRNTIWMPEGQSLPAHILALTQRNDIVKHHATSLSAQSRL